MMHGKINKRGYLEYKRPGAHAYHYKQCPFALDGVNRKPCGDWCALFGEPENKSTGVIGIAICQGRELLLHNFEDNREG